MKQIRLHGPQDLRIDEVPMPQAGPRDVIIKVAVFGICGSDLGFARSGYIGRPGPQPMPIGHELVGVLHQVGNEVQELKVGQRVTVHPTKGANRIGTGDPKHGGFAEYLLVRQAVQDDNVFVLADDLPFERAVLAEPIAVGMHGINQSRVTAQDQVIVLGAGPIGLGLVASLRHRGVRRIAVVDMSQTRLERACQLGAGLGINPAKADMRASLEAFFGVSKIELTGQTVVDCSVVFDCIGNGPLLKEAIGLAKAHSRIVILGTHKEPAVLDLAEMMIKEQTLIGSLSYPDEFSEALDMLRDTQVNIDPMCSHTFAFEAFNEAFAMALNANESAKVTVKLD